MNTDRLLPHSIEAEQGILGCLLLDPNQNVPICVERLKQGAGAFYDLRHHDLYKLLTAMYDAREPIDLITVQQRLKDRNQLEAIGGLAYLSALQDAVPSAANLEFYLGIVRDKFLLRERLATNTRHIHELWEHDGGVSELLDRLDSEVIRQSQQRVEGREVGIKAFVHGAMDRLEQLHQAQGKVIGLETGFRDLDKILGGLKPGEMTIVAARPSVGKSSLALNVAEHVALDLGKAVVIFSCEMSGASLALRSVTSRAGVSASRASAGDLREGDFPRLTRQASILARSKLHIIDQPNLSILELRAKARRLWQQHGIKLVIVDYLQLLHSTSKRADERRLELQEISRGLKTLAGELNVPVVALSQLNRNSERENRRPQLADLRECGDLEQDADAVLLLHRPRADDEATDPNSSEPHRVNVIVAKQRNGPRGDVPLTFFPELTQFKDWSAACLEIEPSEPEL